MPATYADRLDGVATSTAVKAPCRAVATASVALTGLQTIDGIALAARERVLLTEQTDATENGIWSVQSGTWVRALDFDGSRDAVGGTLIFITEGDEFASAWFVVEGNGAIDIGTDDIAISQSQWSQYISLERDDDGLWSVPATVIDDGAWG